MTSKLGSDEWYLERDLHELEIFEIRKRAEQFIEKFSNKRGYECKLCDCKSHSKSAKYYMISHVIRKHFLINETKNGEGQVKIKIGLRRVPMKPWKDPESLFCDTEFLKKLIGKEPMKGKECKDERRNE